MTRVCALFLMLATASAFEALPQSRVRALAAFSAAHGGHALLIRQNGRVIHESYANGHSKNEPHRIYSGTKAFWCLTALLAEKEGLLSLDEPVSGTISEWRDDPGRSRITVRQLLDFTSGLEPLFSLHQNEFKDRAAAALKAPVVGRNGRSFIYGPASLQVFHELLRRKLRMREQPPARYLERRVLAPMGLGPQRYLADTRGAPLLAAGFMQTARQWSELGVWLLKHPDIAASLKPSPANPAYGFGFWNNHAADTRSAREVDVEDLLDKKWQQQSWAGACLSRAAPADLLACIGSYGQRLYIVPSMRLVIVRLAKDSKPDDAAMLRLLFAGG